MTFEPQPPKLIQTASPYLTFSCDHGEKAAIIRDSISEYGHRITTFELTYYRGIHSEMMTHRVFSRNSASSRAIPIMKMLKKVLNDPYVPDYWGKYKKGMQADEIVANPEQKVEMWLLGRNRAVQTALSLMFDLSARSFGDLDMKSAEDGRIHLQNIIEVLEEQDMYTGNAPHKQIVNRILEPYLWHTVILTGTDFKNFFNLRDHEDADPAIRQIAHLMNSVYNANLPEPVSQGSWHLPLVTDKEAQELGIEKAQKVSSARCARTSYLTHDGVRDYDKDLELFDRLVEGKPHLSPLEHVATPTKGYALGNFTGWNQYRTQLFGRTV